MAINLLPTDLAPSSPVHKMADVMKRVGIGATVAFILFLLASGVYLIIISTQLRSSNTAQEQLISSIQSLEQTEQRVVLVKDRLQKAKTILGEKTAKTSLGDFETFQQGLPDAVVLTEVEISPDRSEATLLTSSSASLVQVMGTLFALDLYDKVQLKSFGFTPISGYLVTLEFNN